MKKLFSKFHEAFSEEVFSGKNLHSWEVINFLIGLHSCKDLLSTVSINPAYVEVKVADRFSGDVPLKFFGDKPHDRVLTFYDEMIITGDIDGDFLWVFPLFLGLLLVLITEFGV